MNDTLEPTAERLRRTFQAVADQVADAPPAFDAAPTTDTDAEGIVADIQSTRRHRTGRRWLVAAAAVVAVALLAAGTVLLADSGRHAIRTKPANPTPTTTPLPPPGPPQQFVPSSDTVFPLEGATPSTPETGELVAAVAFTRFIDFPDADRWRDSTIELYADGRLLRFPTPDVHGGIAEQRLTPEGVELVRSAFAPTGLLDPAQTPTDTAVCACVIKVRDDSGGLATNFDPTQPPVDPTQPVDPAVQGEVDRLIEFITHLEASLPATAWADREIKAYVPSRYEVTVWFEPSDAPENLNDGSHNVAVPDLSNVLAQVLPRAVVQHLDDQGWQHTAWQDSLVLTTPDARALAQAFTDAGHTPVWPGFNTWGMGLTYVPAVRAPDPTVMRIRVQALLPDGPPLWAPG
jgi:hypothetical protein